MVDIIFGGKPGTKAHDDFHIAHGKRLLKSGEMSSEHEREFRKKLNR